MQRAGAATPARAGRGGDAVAALRARRVRAGAHAARDPRVLLVAVAGGAPAGRAGVAVVLGGVQPGRVVRGPPGALRGGQRAAAPAHGVPLHKQSNSILSIFSYTCSSTVPAM